MNLWQGILLGLVQGLTEFLPVSSDGHLAVIAHVTGVRTPGVCDVGRDPDEHAQRTHARGAGDHGERGFARHGKKLCQRFDSPSRKARER